MFIASWLDKGKAVIDPLEFRKMLRLEKNYKKFPDFCRRVLDPARSELQKLAEDGFCDCWFDYDRLYLHGQRGGEPDKLVFTIHRAGGPLTDQLAELTDAQRRYVGDMLERFKTMAVKDRAAYTYRAMDELIRSRETVEAEAEEVGDKKEEKEDEKVDGKEAAKPKARTAKTGEKQATDEKVEKITNN